MALEKQRSFEDNPLWKLKVRLQFSGWLQYIIHGILILIVLMITGIGWLIGYWPVVLFWLPLGIAALLSIVLVGTILMVKYGIHPTERIPNSKAEIDAFDLMRTRHSCRSFQSRDLTVEHHAELMAAVESHSQQNQLLGEKFEPKKDHVICVCAIGYESMFKPLLIRAAKIMQHLRLPLFELFFADTSCEFPLETDSAPFNEYGRCYEVCQWSPSSFNGQTTRCAAVTSRNESEEKIVRFDFFVATTSQYYAPVALGIWCANWEAGCSALNNLGHFAVLSPKDRGNAEKSELPRYDISWVVDLYQ